MIGTTGSEPLKCIKIPWGPHTVVAKVGLNDPYSNFSTIFSNISTFSTLQGLNYGACALY